MTKVTTISILHHPSAAMGARAYYTAVVNDEALSDLDGWVRHFFTPEAAQRAIQDHLEETGIWPKAEATDPAQYLADIQERREAKKKKKAADDAEYIEETRKRFTQVRKQLDEFENENGYQDPTLLDELLDLEDSLKLDD